MRVVGSIFTASLLLSVWMFLPENLAAQDGSLDLSFGDSGVVYLPFNSNQLFDMALRPDGNALVNGYTTYGHPIILAFDSNGFPDTSFGSGGSVFPFDTMNVAWSSFVIRDDGEIFVAGGGLLELLNEHGSRDSTYGTAGVVPMNIGGRMVLDHQGRIVAAGYNAVRRFSVETGVDSSFGNAGTALGSTYNRHYSDVMIGPDDEVYAVGAQYPYGPDFIYALFNMFSSVGSQLVYYLSGSYNSGYSAIAHLSDGRLVVVGHTQGIQEMSFQWFSDDGTPLYGTHLQYEFMSDNIGNDLVVDAADRTVVVGSGPGGLNMARLTSDGLLDQTFGVNGWVVPGLPEGRRIALQPDGKILVAGPNYLARFNSDFSTSVIPRQQEPSIMISPDPVSDILTVHSVSLRVESASQQWNAEIIDMTGRVVDQWSVNGLASGPITQDVSFLDQGLYHLRLSNSGSAVMTTNFVKR